MKISDEYKPLVTIDLDKYQEDVKAYQATIDVMWRDFLLEYRLQCRNLIVLSQTALQLNINTTNILR